MDYDSWKEIPNIDASVKIGLALQDYQTNLSNVVDKVKTQLNEQRERSRSH